MRLIRLLKNDLGKEVSEWVKSNIITESQAIKICQQYDIDYHQLGNRSFGYNVLISLGYLFIGLAVITLLGANWEDIPRGVRMAGLIALTMATHVIAIKKYMANGTVLLFLLANLFYGASIILIAQIYHLGEHMPDGVLWWALGCLPIAILVRSPWVMMQSLILAMIWFFMQVDFGFYPGLFLLFIVASIYVLFRGQQSILLFLLVVFSIGCFIEYSLAMWWSDHWYFDFHVEHIAVSVSLFIFAYAASHYLAQQTSASAKDYGAVLAIWSLRFGLIAMFIMSFEEPWRELINEGWHYKTPMFVIVALLSLASLMLAVSTNKLIPIAAILAFYLISLFVLMFASHSSSVQIFQVIYNIALIGIGVGLVIKGIQHGVTHYFFLGVITILLTALMRYIDLIGDYIGGAILFAVFAAVLLGAAKFWKYTNAKVGAQ
ncbi:MAG: DUF2157 domain-containing protein [Gammaproteobacteria bacterium]